MYVCVLLAATALSALAGASTPTPARGLSRSQSRIALDRPQVVAKCPVKCPVQGVALTPSLRKSSHWELKIEPPLADQEIAEIVQRVNRKRMWTAKREDEHLRKVWKRDE